MKEYMERMIAKYEGRLDWLEEESKKEKEDRAKGVFEGMAFYSKDFIKDLQQAKDLLEELQDAKYFLEELQQLKECSK